MNVHTLPQVAGRAKISPEAGKFLACCEEGNLLGPVVQAGAQLVDHAELSLNYEEAPQRAWVAPSQFVPGETGLAGVDVYQAPTAGPNGPAVVHVHYNSPARFGVDVRGTSARGKSRVDGVYFVPDLSQVHLLSGNIVCDKATAEGLLRQTFTSLDRNAQARINQDACEWGMVPARTQYSTAMGGREWIGRPLHTPDGDEWDSIPDRQEFDRSAAETLHYGLSQVMGLLPPAAPPQARASATGAVVGFVTSGVGWVAELLGRKPRR